MTATLPDLIGQLARNWPHQELDRVQYERELADCPLDALAAAVRVLLRVPREWRPGIGDVRAAVAEKLLALPSERDAARQVDARIAWARDRQGDPPPVHALVREAVAHVGGWHSIRAADRPEVVRGQLLRFYRDARQAEIRETAAQDMDAITPA